MVLPPRAGSCALQLNSPIGLAAVIVPLLAGAGALCTRKCRETHQGRRNWVDFTLDCSKQLITVCCVRAGLQLYVPNCEHLLLTDLGEATLCVMAEYVLLKIISAMMELIEGHGKLYRTGEYRDYRGDFMVDKYFRQLAVWLVCVGITEGVLHIGLNSLPQVVDSAEQTVLRAVSWNPELETVLVAVILPTFTVPLQLWLTDAFIKKGGLPPWRAAFALLRAMVSAAVALVRAIFSLLSALLQFLVHLAGLGSSKGDKRGDALGRSLLEDSARAAQLEEALEEAERRSRESAQHSRAREVVASSVLAAAMDPLSPQREPEQQPSPAATPSVEPQAPCGRWRRKRPICDAQPAAPPNSRGDSLVLDLEEGLLSISTVGSDYPPGPRSPGGRLPSPTGNFSFGRSSFVGSAESDESSRSSADGIPPLPTFSGSRASRSWRGQRNQDPEAAFEPRVRPIEVPPRAPHWTEPARTLVREASGLEGILAAREEALQELNEHLEELFDEIQSIDGLEHGQIVQSQMPPEQLAEAQRKAQEEAQVQVQALAQALREAQAQNRSTLEQFVRRSRAEAPAAFAEERRPRREVPASPDPPLPLQPLQLHSEPSWPSHVPSSQPPYLQPEATRPPAAALLQPPSSNREAGRPLLPPFQQRSEPTRQACQGTHPEADLAASLLRESPPSFSSVPRLPVPQEREQDVLLEAPSREMPPSASEPRLLGAALQPQQSGAALLLPMAAAPEVPKRAEAFPQRQRVNIDARLDSLLEVLGRKPEGQLGAERRSSPDLPEQTPQPGGAEGSPPPAAEAADEKDESETESLSHRLGSLLSSGTQAHKQRGVQIDEKIADLEQKLGDLFSGYSAAIGATRL